MSELAEKLDALLAQHYSGVHGTEEEFARISTFLAAVAREVPDLIDMAASYLNICPDRHGHSVETLNRARASLAALAKEIG